MLRLIGGTIGAGIGLAVGQSTASGACAIYCSCYRPNQCFPPGEQLLGHLYRCNTRCGYSFEYCTRRDPGCYGFCMSQSAC